MDEDLKQALELLAQHFEISADAAEELLILIERAETDSPRSVLNVDLWPDAVRIAGPGGNGCFWVVQERIYDFSFLVVVRETRRGFRAIAGAKVVTHPSSKPR